MFLESQSIVDLHYQVLHTRNFFHMFIIDAKIIVSASLKITSSDNHVFSLRHIKFQLVESQLF
jgi:hypothetical protein